jgi:hypothetical protein
MEISCRHTDTIDEVKLKILEFKLPGFKDSPDRVILLHDKTELQKGHRTLGSYKIVREVTLHLRLRKSGPEVRSAGK